MNLVKKLLAIMLIFAVFTAIGCIGNTDETPTTELSVSSPGTVTEVESSDDAVQFRLVQDEPIEVMRDYTIYNEWHGRMKQILEENKGEYVKIYSYNMQLAGDIVEVEEHFVVLDNDLIGTCFVDIDSINAIAILDSGLN